MVIAVFSAMCLVGALGNDEASLLQSSTDKKRLQAASATQWIEEFAHSPDEVVMRLANMQPSEQTSLLQKFASADASSLVEEMDRHKVAMALALRGSPLSQGSPSDWVSALQQARSAEVESAVSFKKDKLRSKNDGKNSSSFPESFEAKDDVYQLVGGRCRTGEEFDDLALDDATPEETCKGLCDSNDACDSFEWEDNVCKRFTASLKTYRRGALSKCAKRCSKKEECVAFEWDNGECELHGNETDSTLSAAEELGDEHACYFKNMN